MNRRVNWLLAGLSILLVAGLMLAGCSTPASTQAPAPAPATTQAPSSAPAKTTTSAPATTQAPATSKAPTTAPATTAAPKPTAAKVQWKVISSLPGTTNPFNAIMADMVKDINTQAAGRLELTLFTSGELPYQGADYLRVLRDGSVQMADTVTGRISGDAPIMNIDGLPFFVGTLDEFFKLVDVGRPYFATELKKFNQTAITYLTYPPQQIFTVPKATTVEELKGIKIRTNTTLQGDMLKLLGAVPVVIDVGEVPTALQYGTVQGVVTAWFNLTGSKWNPLVKYALDLDINVAMHFIAVNNDAFAALPKDLQDIVMSVGTNYEKNIFPKRLFGMDTDEKAKAIAGGITDTQVPAAKRAEVAKLNAPLWQDWAKKSGGSAPDLLAAVSKALGK